MSATRLFHRPAQKVGAAPGTLIHVGERLEKECSITLIHYDQGSFDTRLIPAKELRESCLLRDSGKVSWLNVDGLHDVALIDKLGQCFGLHPLTLEDILNTGHRPKIEIHDNSIFIVLKMLFFDEATSAIETEQVSLILGPSYVLSFQERAGDVFDGVRERIRHGKGRIRRRGPDYLAYALLDAVVDSYFAILEQIGDQIELLEDELIGDPTPATLQKIHTFKREMILLRKSIWPLREVISGLQREESELIEEATGVFLRDVYDHTIQVVDTVETFRDIISGMLDLYLSSISHRMNEVMKVLTIMASIFIPLTFMAGIYGMNFEYIPELKWRWGYPALWTLMASTAAAMIVYFRRRKWL